MQLIKRAPKRVSPFHPDEFSRFFDDFFGPAHYAVPQLNKVPQIAVDIFEKEEKIIIKAEISGVEKEDIEVDVKGKLLTLKAEKKEESEVKEEAAYRRERRYGKFERSFNLPYEINEDHVAATYKNGLLTLEISQPEEQKTKQITIN